MKLKYIWKNYFQQELIKEVRSPINGVIQIIKVFDKPRLMIGGMIQSGGMVRKIWKRAIDKLVKEGTKINNALIIGLGCGDCAFEIQKHFPKSKMRGVEIDKHVVDLAKCFFDLTKVNNLKISISDGAKFLEKELRLKKKYELVIVDAYIGEKTPSSFRSIKFFNNLYRVTAPEGVAVINHLFFGKYKDRAKKMVESVSRVFKTVKLQRTASNLLIFGYR